MKSSLKTQEQQGSESIQVAERTEVLRDLFRDGSRSNFRTLPCASLYWLFCVASFYNKLMIVSAFLSSHEKFLKIIHSVEKVTGILLNNDEKKNRNLHIYI